MKKNLITAVLMTIVTTVLLGIFYPLLVTALAQVLFHDKANGQLISRDGELVGSRIIGQPFSSDPYFHSRPSSAGNGYDAANSSASSHEIRSNASASCPCASGPFGTPAFRRIGYSSLSGEYTRSRYFATFPHKNPRVTGCDGSP